MALTLPMMALCLSLVIGVLVRRAIYTLRKFLAKASGLGISVSKT